MRCGGRALVVLTREIRKATGINRTIRNSHDWNEMIPRRIATLLACTYATSTSRWHIAATPISATTTSTCPSTNKSKLLSIAANEARGLAMDSIAEAKSGHLGLPLGAAEIGAILYGSQMTYIPKDPSWINRDRFILSAGHGSMFLYAWLHISGFDLSMEELKRFRQFRSMTPGHPEFEVTPGVECTTGPLGQGISNAVGFAASEKMAEAVYNTERHEIFDHHIFVLAGDGCLQEGVSAEAACFAAHERLDNLIVLYDANNVTLDKMADYTQSEDIIKRYEAYGWETFEIDGHNLHQIEATISAAKSRDNGKPKFIKCNTIIGKGIEDMEGTSAAHGEAGLPYINKAKNTIGLPEDERWYVSQATRDYFQAVQKANKSKYDEWQATYSSWKEINPTLATQLENAVNKSVMPSKDIIKDIPEIKVGAAEATRVSGNKVLQEISKRIPNYISGSADLHSSTRNYINDGGNFGSPHLPLSDKTYDGKNLHFGIREHAMGTIMNGFAYHGLFRISGSTFLVFADYLRPTIRLAALSELGSVSYIFTHDSISVGEDGPTHQPVETLSSLRVIPNLDVYRPADAEETVAAFVHSVTRTNTPTAIVLSRQNIQQNCNVPFAKRRDGALKGAYIAKKEKTRHSDDNHPQHPELIIIATGSEVALALEVAANIPEIRVVSMPCMEVFERQSDAYKESVLPQSCQKRIAMEAGVSALWYKYANRVVGVDRFGYSAPGDVVRKELGMTSQHLLDAVTDVMKD